MLSTVQHRPDSAAPAAPRETGRLLADLAVIDVEGWGGPTGTALLDFVRDDLVRPLVLGTGLRDLAAWQAEATGWEAAWEALSHPSLPAAASPWGVVWTAVRRAVLGEVVTARYHASPFRTRSAPTSASASSRAERPGRSTCHASSRGRSFRRPVTMPAVRAAG